MRVLRPASLALLAVLSGCVLAPRPAPVPIPAPQAALTLVKLSPSQYPDFSDDADTTSLRFAAARSLEYYRGRPATESYTLASDSYTAAEMVDSLEYFIHLLDEAKTPEEWKDGVRKSFQVYQSVGTDDHHTVTFSSYYEPSIPARLKRTETYRYPLYGRPPDLIDVDLGQFDPVYQGARISGRRDGRRLVPYYTRRDIDSRKILRKQAPVVAWAKSQTDIFFLQIEGSGWLELGENHKRRIRYDGDNGRKYRSVGLYLISSGRIPSGQMSHDEFEHYMNRHPKERQELLNFNDRYVFFRIDTSSTGAMAYGNLEQPLTPWRSVATDPKLFPKGTLAWISTDQPLFNKDGKVTGSAPLTRFVLNQDEGGAIQGPGRVDFFAGDGLKAHRFATHFWQKGTLYFVVRKKAS
jgi:membrane-bound lytic murein transglycosylase A